MNKAIEELKEHLASAFAGQASSVALWHQTEPMVPPKPEQSGLASALPLLIQREHYFNFLLWHVEDEARRKDVDDSVIAGCKRRVDKLNQQRNDAMEEVDKYLCALLQPLLPQGGTGRRNTESVGMAVDRLSILALKVYHMGEQTERADVDAAHILSCKEKLAVLRRQRDDLAVAVLELIDDYAQGLKTPMLYSQFKMYNDPSLNPQLYGKEKGGRS